MSGSICDICQGPAAGVVSSVLGAISYAICTGCAGKNVEPWPILVGGLYGLERGQVAQWVEPIIRDTLEFYGRTEDQLWEDVAALTRDYQAYLQAKQEEGRK